MMILDTVILSNETDQISIKAAQKMIFLLKSVNVEVTEEEFNKLKSGKLAVLIADHPETLKIRHSLVEKFHNKSAYGWW
jgi:hypothetical protein